MKGVPFFNNSDPNGPFGRNSNRSSPTYYRSADGSWRIGVPPANLPATNSRSLESCG